MADIERYLLMPGQVLAYKVGMNTLLAARERAHAALGARFDLKAFHNLILQSGSMPMTLLNTRVDQWIAKQQGT
ncbi:MAG: DUF885 family protein [Aquimonas sp.]|nr:DUF885 family protein [Aquimonas sp.]